MQPLDARLLSTTLRGLARVRHRALAAFYLVTGLVFVVAATAVWRHASKNVRAPMAVASVATGSYLRFRKCGSATPDSFAAGLPPLSLRMAVGGWLASIIVGFIGAVTMPSGDLAAEIKRVENEPLLVLVSSLIGMLVGGLHLPQKSRLAIGALASALQVQNWGVIQVRTRAGGAPVPATILLVIPAAQLGCMLAVMAAQSLHICGPAARQLEQSAACIERMEQLRERNEQLQAEKERLAYECAMATRRHWRQPACADALSTSSSGLGPTDEPSTHDPATCPLCDPSLTPVLPSWQWQAPSRARIREASKLFDAHVTAQRRKRPWANARAFGELVWTLLRRSQVRGGDNNHISMLPKDCLRQVVAAVVAAECERHEQIEPVGLVYV